MATRKRVSEKTLELNVTSEILQAVRGVPGCGGAFWIGMKQHQEARNGIDEILSNVPTAMHLAIQFKAPAASRPDSEPYRYSLNERQHGRLFALAHGKPNAVWYAFPNYNTFTRIRSESPTLLAHTYLMNIAATGALHGIASGRHKLECNEKPTPYAMVYSEPTRVGLLPAKALLNEDAESPLVSPNKRQQLLANEDLMSWIDDLVSTADGNLRRVGQWLRGFGTLCVP